MPRQFLTVLVKPYITEECLSCAMLAQAGGFISCHFVTEAVLTNVKKYRKDEEQLIQRN